MQDENTVKEQVTKQVEELIKCINDEGIREDNVKFLGELVDIHKDFKNEDYWKNKEEMLDMRYRTSGRDSYGARRRDSRGRYMDGRGSGNYGTYMEGGRDGNYGRRYRGHDMLDDMYENYGNYMEDIENGRYGSPETDKAFDYMLESAEEFFNHLFEESDSPEQIEKIKRVAKRISEKRM